MPNTGQYNPFGAGKKVYGSGRYNPTSGPVDKAGYADRDRKRKVKLNALGARTKANQKGAFASSSVLRYGK